MATIAPCAPAPIAAARRATARSAARCAARSMVVSTFRSTLSSPSASRSESTNCRTASSAYELFAASGRHSSSATVRRSACARRARSGVT
jgi:hypothetical protein